MSKLIFSEQEVKRLRKNIYVKNVSHKAITYTLEFKKKFIEDYNNNELPRYIFEKYNFDVDTIGMERVKSASKRWRKAFNNNSDLGLVDRRKGASGRPLVRTLTSQEEIERLNARIEFLKMENDFLKKLDKIERGDA